METNEPDNTIKEILEEDRSQNPRKRRGKGCLVRLLIIAILLFIGFYGFILFRQKMLDLEAEAVVRAHQTLTTQADEKGSTVEETVQSSTDSSVLKEMTMDPTFVETVATDTMPTRTVKFLQTVTPGE